MSRIIIRRLALQYRAGRGYCMPYRRHDLCRIGPFIYAVVFSLGRWAILRRLPGRLYYDRVWGTNTLTPSDHRFHDAAADLHLTDVF